MVCGDGRTYPEIHSSDEIESFVSRVLNLFKRYDEWHGGAVIPQLDLGALLHWRSLAENISANCPCKQLRKPGRPSNNLQLDKRRMFCCAHTSTLEMQCSKLKMLVSSS